MTPALVVAGSAVVVMVDVAADLLSTLALPVSAVLVEIRRFSAELFHFDWSADFTLEPLDELDWPLMDDD